jgi:hypothetical protein
VPPRPRAAAAPETVGASELGALTVTRATALRAEPSARAERFGALKPGETVLRLDARGAWYRVWVPGVALAGWIEKGSAGAAPSAPAGPEGIPVAELPVVTVAKGGVRLRKGPSARAEAVRTLEKGEPLRLLRDGGAWSKVYDPATQAPAYISAPLIERPR